MFEAIKPYLWIAELVAVGLLAICCTMGGYSYAHKDVAVVQTKLDNANSAIAQRDSVLKDCDAATKDAQGQEAAAKDRESKAQKELDTVKKEKTQKEIVFVNKTTELTKQPECAVLKEHLCPAAMGY